MVSKNDQDVVPIGENVLSKKKAVVPDEEIFHVGKLELTGSIFVGMAIWAYCFVNVLVVNTDPLMQSLLPSNMIWLVQFKFIVLLALLSIFWISVGTKQFLFSSSFVLFFPLVITGMVIWHIGKTLLVSRSWIIVLASVELITSALTNFKVKFFLVTATVIAAAYILVGRLPYLLFASACIIFFLVVLAYLRSFMSAISPPTTFKMLRTFLEKDENIRFKSFQLDEQIRGKPVSLLSSVELTKWTQVLQNSIIYNRVMLFYARTMRDYQRSNLLFMPGIFTIFRLTSFTVLGFAFVNFAVFKLDKAAFSATSPPGLFKFFYYSFNSLVLNGIDDIKPTLALSQSLLMAQECLSFVLAIIAVSLFVSYRTQRASSDLDAAIEVAEREAASIESLLQREFKIANITKAIDHLRQAEGNLLGFVHWLSRGI